MTLVGRRELDHPALGTAGGAGLHTSIETIYTNIGDDLGGRFKAYSSVANSVVTNIKHNFGVAFSELNIFVYTGTFPNLTLATNYTVAVDGGNPTTHINVTTPGSGGPHTFAVFIAQGAIDASQIKAAVANASKFISYDGSGNVVATKDVPTGAVVGTTDTQVLTNKTVQQALVDDFLEFNEETSPATPASGKVRLYPKSDGKFYRKDDTGLEQVVGGGSGAGGINYLLSSGKAWDFEDGLSTGWGVYADAAGVAPVDGTGGTANVTFAASASSPQRGIYSGLFTKDAANRQGDGVSVDFTLDTQDVGKPFTFSFDTIASANFTGVSGTESMRVYCYDVTNAALLPGYVDISPGSSTTKGLFLATSSTSYRFIIHVSGTGTSAWTLKIDNVIVGQQTVTQGNAITDWIDYVPTFTGFGTPSGVVASYARFGSSIAVKIKFASGTSTSTEARISLPTGLTSGTPNALTMVGSYARNTNAATANQVYIENGASYLTFGRADGTLAGYTKRNADQLIGLAEEMGFTTSLIPISQWSSNITMADRAVEEFSFNTSTTDADDTTSFGYGAVGNNVPGVTAQRSKRIRFQTPIQPTDKLIIELSDLAGTKWYELSNSGATNGVSGYTTQNTATYGIGISASAVNATDVNIVFGQYGAASGATFGSAGTAWSALTTYKWRVRKIAGGALVGYPIGARNVIGDTTGNAVPSGYIGQIIEALTSSSFSQASPVLGTLYDVPSVSISVPPGNWTIFAESDVNVTTNDAVTTRASFAEIAIRDGSNNELQKARATPIAYGNTGLTPTAYGHGIVSLNLNVSATTTYKMSIRAVNVTGSPTMLALDAAAASVSPSKIWAVRRG